jgi:hypothetical protein
MSANQNNRETGARKLVAKIAKDASDEVSQDAAKNRRPATGTGLSEPQNDVNDKMRHSDGLNQYHNLALPGPPLRKS